MVTISTASTGDVTQVSHTMIALLCGIAVVSRVVGGIGVMNIMLLSVMERTKEIRTRWTLYVGP